MRQACRQGFNFKPPSTVGADDGNADGDEPARVPEFGYLLGQRDSKRFGEAVHCVGSVARPRTITSAIRLGTVGGLVTA